MVSGYGKIYYKEWQTSSKIWLIVSFLYGLHLFFLKLFPLIHINLSIRVVRCRLIPRNSFTKFLAPYKYLICCNKVILIINILSHLSLPGIDEAFSNLTESELIWQEDDTLLLFPTHDWNMAWLKRVPIRILMKTPLVVIICRKHIRGSFNASDSPG